ncbi:MAG: hypothetical protein K6B52_02670 [Clostridiales bacterium]|nr:hypothetical protein [Clostridiales bacterium]
MKNLLKKKLNSFVREVTGKRGSGILTILVTTVFLFALCSSLLFLTYTGLQMKVSIRKGSEAMAVATTSMDDVKVAVQDIVSECTEKAYAAALVDYSVNSVGVSSVFADRFVSQFREFTNTVLVEKEDGTKVPESTHLLYDNYSKYSVKVLRDRVNYTALNTELDEEYLAAHEGLTIPESSIQIELTTLTGMNDVQVDTQNGKIILRNVMLTATVNGNTATIVTDISIVIPDLGSSLSQFQITGVPEFAIIANGAIRQDGLEVNAKYSGTKVNGSFYANGIELIGTNSISFDAGDMILATNADVKTGSAVYDANGNPIVTDFRMTLGETARFWAQNINVHYGAGVQLLGKTSLYNDLNLNGNGARADIGGTYFGFGNAVISDSGVDGTNLSDLSSSIIAEGKNTKINILADTDLKLAGVSFIQNTKGVNTGEAIMGESISTRQNQRLYLLPADYFYYVEAELTEAGVNSGRDKAGAPKVYSLVNPVVFDSVSKFANYNYHLVDDMVLWTIEGEDRTLAYYRTFGADINLKVMGINYAGQSAAYVFLDFGNDANGIKASNEFFKDYFTAKPELVSRYVSDYVKVTAEDSVTLNTIGNYVVDENGLLVLKEPSLSKNNYDTLGLDCGNYQRQYELISRTLTFNEIDDPDITPYSYYINSATGDSLKPYNGLTMTASASATLPEEIKAGDDAVNSYNPSTGKYNADSYNIGDLLFEAFDSDGNYLKYNENGSAVTHYQYNRATGTYSAVTTQAAEVARIYFGNASIDDKMPDTVALVITMASGDQVGDVTVKRNFSGLIISAGEISIAEPSDGVAGTGTEKMSIEASPTRFATAFSALEKAGIGCKGTSNLISEDKYIFNVDPTNSESWQTGGQGTNITALVQYENWSTR